MSDKVELESLRREVETLRARVAELQRRAARHEDSDGISIPEREELLAEAERLAHLGTWTWNLETGAVGWSPELYRILGYPFETTPSTEAFFGAIHPDDRERVQATSASSVAEGIVPQIDCRVQRSDGSIRHITMTGTMLFDEHGQLRRIVGAILDLTDARRAAEQNRRAFQELEEAQAIGQLGSWRLDLITNQLTWSREFVRILGLPADTVPTPDVFLSCLHLDDRARFARTHAHMLDNGGTAEAEGRVVWPDGTIRHVRVNGVARRVDDGSIVEVSGTMLDITEQIELREDLVRVQKMEAIGRLAGGIAHDFNNLLTIITTNLDLARETLADRGAPAPPEFAECTRALASASALTQRLLTFGRKASLSLRVVDINELVDGTMVLLRRLVGDQIRLETLLRPELPAVRVDPIEIERALINLVVNARDALPSGGLVRLETARVTQADELFVEISVADDGPGIEPAARDHLFEPFFTTKAKGKGTGLGLATVLGTAEQHGGTVVVDSPRGGGTVFRMRLPAVRATGGPSPSHAADTTASTTTPRKKVLVVDDEAQVARVIERCLGRQGHRVIVSTEPAAALAEWAEHAATIDLIICDVVMAPMRGPELVRKLAQTHPLPPVLFITGYSEEAARADLEHPVLPKPFSVDSLMAAVDRALSRVK